MNKEANNNFTSLFDEPNKPLWQKSKPDFQIYQVSNVLTMKKINSQSIKKGKFFISNEFLVEVDNKSYKRHIDLNNIILEQTNQPFTFRLSRNKKQIEFTTNEQEYQVWFQLIKKYAIQRTFNEDYKLLKVQGQGNFAKVYKAIGRGNFAYAVKSFEKKSFKNLTIERDALKLEISIMRKIQFPGIIRLYEVYETDNHIWLVTDYLEGGELFQYLRNQPQGFNEVQVALLMHNLLNSLDYLHSQGIIHRDIKPENLILRSPINASDVCIADFGLADYYNQEGKYLFKRCGTPGYVAPEILQEKNYDYKVDVFSAGILMFIMLSGQSPFQTKSKNELVIKNYNCEINYTINNLQQKISPEALQLLMILLSPNPQSRYTAKQALCHPWFMKCFTPIYQMNPPQLYMPTSMIPQFQHYPDIFARSPIMNQFLNQSISNLSLSGSSSNLYNLYLIQHLQELNQIHYKYKILVKLRQKRIIKILKLFRKKYVRSMKSINIQSIIKENKPQFNKINLLDNFNKSYQFYLVLGLLSIMKMLNNWKNLQFLQYYFLAFTILKQCNQ